MLELPPDAYIPVLPVLRFIQRCESQQGFSDFGFQASQQTLFSRLSEDFITVSQSAPTLGADSPSLIGPLTKLWSVAVRAPDHQNGEERIALNAK